MKRFLCFIIVAAFSATSSEAIDCKNNTCSDQGLVHVLCKYPSENPAPACETVVSIGFTESERNEIVKTHNDLRQYVAAGKETRGKPGPQPPAEYMKTIVWDSNLAYTAQRWANQCHFGHDECRKDGQMYVGQNVAAVSGTSNMDVKSSSLIQMWYNEVEKFDRNQVSRLTNVASVGHYTQLVYGDTDKIGCGKIVYITNKWRNNYLVCNYGPGGNIINEPVYKIRN